MKKFNKILSLGLSLAMCAGMVAPAFAAVAFDKDYHVGDGGVLLSHKEVVDGDIIQSYDYFLDNDVELDQTLIIKDGVDASIDLNGYDLALNKGLEVDTENAKVTGAGEDTKQGSVIAVTGEGTSLTVTDNSDEGNGTISGGYSQPASGAGFGGGIKVDDNASLDLQGGTITNNVASNGGGVYVGKGTVTMGEGAAIDGNLATMGGGGVYLNTELASRTDDEAVFTMNGGSISNNTASGIDANGNIVGGGGGIGTNLYAESPDPDYEAIVINGGTITGNKAEVDGAGIYVNNGKVSITDSTISDNTAAAIQGSGDMQRGGGIYANGDKTTVTVTDSTISGNSATRGGGVYAQNKAQVTLKGDTVTGNDAKQGGGIVVWLANVNVEDGKIYNNTASTNSADIYSYKSTLKLPLAGTMNVIGADGKPITGWYFDGNDRYGNGQYAYVTQNFPTNANGYTGTLCLKAAHDEYFNVVYTDGRGNDLWATEAENNTGIPVYTGEIPNRPGYSFGGWLLDGSSVDWENGVVNGALTLEPLWIPVPAVDDPIEPDTGDVTVGDIAIPLASGPITRAEFIDYLWRHEGEPASDGVCSFTDVPADHEYVLALAWAEQNGVAAAYEDGSFEPDELVTVAAVREFLGNFAQTFGMTMPQLTALTGDDDEAVINCAEVVAEFFGEEYAASDMDEAA